MALTFLHAVSWVLHPRSPKTHKLYSQSDFRPLVYLDIEVNGKPEGRLLLELAADKLPKTCENFRALCTGEQIF